MSDKAFEAMCKIVGVYGGAIDELINIMKITGPPLQMHRLRDLETAIAQSVNTIKAGKE